MKYDKFSDIVIVVLLLSVLYANPEFLQKFSHNLLGKAVLLTIVLSLTLHNNCMGFLAGLIFIILLKSHRENFEDGGAKQNGGDEEEEEEEDKKEGMRNPEEEEEEEEEGDDIPQENIKNLEKNPIESFGKKNARQMKAISTQLVGIMDGLAAENSVRPKKSSSTVLELYKEKYANK